MAKLWGVKDGARPANQEGKPLEVTMAELTAIVKGFTVRWTGTEEPSITPESMPSTWARYTVAQVEASDSVSAAFPRPGYYHLVELDPYRAETTVGEHRAKALEGSG
jgi:hypothetical protein